MKPNFLIKLLSSIWRKSLILVSIRVHNKYKVVIINFRLKIITFQVFLARTITFAKKIYGGIQYYLFLQTHLTQNKNKLNKS